MVLETQYDISSVVIQVAGYIKKKKYKLGVRH